MIVSSSAWCHADEYTTDDFAIEQWQSPYPYLTVSYTSTLPGLQSSATGVYAGVFGAIDNNTGQHYDILCNELNASLPAGPTCTAEIYNSFAIMPMLDGYQGNVSGDQKELLTGLFAETGALAQSVVSIDVLGGQYLGGITRDSANDPSVLMNLTDEQAAAYQMLAWELIQEPFDPSNPLANIGLTGGGLQFYQADGTPFSQDFIDLYNNIANTALIDSGLLSPPEPVPGGPESSSVPEPLPVLGILTIAFGLMALRWHRNKARQAALALA